MKPSLQKQSSLLIILIFLSPSLVAQTFSISDSHVTQRKAPIIAGGYKIEIEVVERDGQNVARGKIMDNQTGEPLPGINVIEKGTHNGTVSDNGGRFNIQLTTPEGTLVYSSTGYNTQESTVPVTSLDDNESLTALSGMLVGNFGEESVIQPNIMFSQSWEIIKDRAAIQLRILGFQKNKDTLQLINGLNLIKPEISKINFRLAGDFLLFESKPKWSTNFELNIFRQQLNRKDDNVPEIEEDDITSLLFKFSAGYKPADGLHFYASGVYYNIFNGVEFYQERFGNDAAKKYLNFELSGKFQIKDGPLKGAFIQALFNVNSEDYKQLLKTKDSAVFLIRLGFDKPLQKTE